MHISRHVRKHIEIEYVAGSLKRNGWDNAGNGSESHGTNVMCWLSGAMPGMDWSPMVRMLGVGWVR